MRKTDKGVVVSFRVDRHLSHVLRKVPDKSAFIRDIILRSFYEACPLCRGRGVLPPELAAWTTRQLKAAKALECECCRFGYPDVTRKRGRSDRKAGVRFTCRHCQDHAHGH
jgi:hypothetical protein